jgi:hypothetical protein
MGIAAGAEEGDVGGESDVAGDLLPAKWKSSMPNHMFSPLPLTV